MRPLINYNFGCYQICLGKSYKGEWGLKSKLTVYNFEISTVIEKCVKTCCGLGFVFITII